MLHIFASLSLSLDPDAAGGLESSTKRAANQPFFSFQHSGIIVIICIAPKAEY